MLLKSATGSLASRPRRKPASHGRHEPENPQERQMTTGFAGSRRGGTARAVACRQATQPRRHPRRPTRRCRLGRARGARCPETRRRQRGGCKSRVSAARCRTTSTRKYRQAPAQSRARQRRPRALRRPAPAGAAARESPTTAGPQTTTSSGLGGAPLVGPNPALHSRGATSAPRLTSSGCTTGLRCGTRLASALR